MDVVTAAGLLKTASDLTTRIRESLAARDVKLDEVVARIIEIQGLISDGRTAFIDVQEELLEKNRAIFALERELRKNSSQRSRRAASTMAPSGKLSMMARRKGRTAPTALRQPATSSSRTEVPSTTGS